MTDEKKSVIDADDPFRYDPIGNFKQLGKQQMWHSICMQQMLVQMLKREYGRIQQIYRNKLEADIQASTSGLIYDTRQDLFDAYMTGEIDDDTYDGQLRIIEKPKPNHWRLLEWLTWLEIMFKEQTLLYEEMKDIYHSIQENRLPKNYGYDPRSNRSRLNYPREDWGKTREHIYEHKRKRKQKEYVPRKRQGTGVTTVKQRAKARAEKEKADE